MGEIRVLNEQGDVTVTWDPKDAESVKRAEAEFERLKADGYDFFTVVETKGKAIKKFDPTLERLIAAPGARKPAEQKRGHRPKAMAGGPVASSSRRRR